MIAYAVIMLNHDMNVLAGRYMKYYKHYYLKVL